MIYLLNMNIKQKKQIVREEVSMLSKKRFVLSLKVILVIILFISVFILIPHGLSRYQTITGSNVEIDMAFYVVGTSMTKEDLIMNDITPSQEPYIYTFTVQNYDDRGRIETKASYTINITTTTNIPFLYEVYKTNGLTKENIILEETVTQDEDLMYFRNIRTKSFEFDFKENQTDLYQLYIYYPNDYDSYEFQNIVENISITIDSKQMLESDNV